MIVETTLSDTWERLYKVESAERQQLLTLLIEARLHLAFMLNFTRGKCGRSPSLDPAQQFLDAGIYGRNNLTEKVS